MGNPDTTKRIEKLIIQNFRGATRPLELNFDTSKPLVMIFGENGTGKTSIVDALGFICNQEAGSIKERSSVNEKKHLPAIGKNEKDIAITLQVNERKCLATFDKKGPSVSSEEHPRAEILRRNKILKLIDAPPGERFKALSQFLSVPNIEKCENTLRVAIKTQKDKYDRNTHTIHQSNQALENLKKELGEEEKPTQEWSKEFVQPDSKKLNETIRKHEELNELKRVLEQAYQAFKSAENELASKTKTAHQTRTALDEFQKQDASTDEGLQKLLMDAGRYFEKHRDTQHCPVCRQTVNAAELGRKIQERLEAMDKLAIFVAANRNAKAAREDAEKLLNTRRSDYNNAARTLVEKLKASSGNDRIEENGGFDYVKLCNEFQELIDPAEENKAKNELEKYKRHIFALNEQKKELEKKEKRKDYVQKLMGEIETYKQEASRNGLVLKLLHRYLEITEHERKAYVQSVLSDVSAEVDRLYGLIHPGEGLGGFRLFMKQSAKASLEYDCTFQSNEEVPPQAYFSDAHLDTLGICLFLALAKHFKDENTILVLDDVVASLDGPHRDRFLKVIHVEAENFCHLILTTHHRPWRDHYSVSDGAGDTVDLIDLQTWSREKGITFSKSPVLSG